MNERNKQLIKWINSLYCPKWLTVNCFMLLDELNHTDYRAVDPVDYGSMHLKCLIIKTKGVGNRKSFAGWEICRVDVGKTTLKQANIAIIRDQEQVEIRRINYKTNLEINIQC